MSVERSDTGVSVLIPAYRPTGRLLDTLQSLAAQSLPPARVHLSLDFAPDAEPLELPDLPGLVVHRQQQRLGWADNVNWLLGQVTTPFFMILGHDDCISPGYLAETVAALQAHPEAVVAHGQCRHYGVRGGEIAFTTDLRGGRYARVLEFLERKPHLAELGWRGVVRTSALQSGLRLRHVRSDGGFSNTLWALELLTLGESVALPQVHYDKHTDPVAGLSRDFHRRDVGEKSLMLADNLACLVEVLGKAGFSESEQHELLARYVQWILELGGAWNVLSDRADFEQMSYPELLPAVTRFIANALLSLAADCKRAQS